MACASPPAQLNPGITVVPATCQALPAVQLSFESSFWLNLHNFLFKEAKRRAGIDDGSTGARGNVNADTAGTRALTRAEATLWNAAVGFYRKGIGGGTHRADSLVIEVNDYLAGLRVSEQPRAGRSDQDVLPLLGEVAGIYRAVWWPIHDRRNQEWIATTRSQIERYGGCIFPRLAFLLRADWPADTIRVYPSVYANWFGAYSTRIRGPKVTLSSNAVGNLETYGLESTIHESVHAGALLTRIDSTITALAERGGTSSPAELSHAILFFTVGEVIREVIPTHLPYAERFGIWSRNPALRRIHQALIRHWLPYLNGETDFDSALMAVVSAAS